MTNHADAQALQDLKREQKWGHPNYNENGVWNAAIQACIDHVEDKGRIVAPVTDLQKLTELQEPLGDEFQAAINKNMNKLYTSFVAPVTDADRRYAIKHLDEIIPIQDASGMQQIGKGYLQTIYQALSVPLQVADVDHVSNPVISKEDAEFTLGWFEEMLIHCLDGAEQLYPEQIKTIRACLSSPQRQDREIEYLEMLSNQAKTIREYQNRQDNAEVLAMAVRKVLEEGVQETSGQYKSQKNNKCVHGNFGYEGCEQCTEEFLSKALAEYEQSKQSGAPSQPAVPQDKCHDCGADLINVCSGLENNTGCVSVTQDVLQDISHALSEAQRLLKNETIIGESICVREALDSLKPFLKDGA